MTNFCSVASISVPFCYDVLNPVLLVQFQCWFPKSYSVHSILVPLYCLSWQKNLVKRNKIYRFCITEFEKGFLQRWSLVIKACMLHCCVEATATVSLAGGGEFLYKKFASQGEGIHWNYHIVIAHVRYIKVLAWLGGFTVKLLYLAWFSLCGCVLLELRHKEILKKLISVLTIKPC